MLLRRISQHVKDQNWTAIALDILIVVCGVFIGIQVANWNEARQERVQADLMMERIVEDINSARDLAGGLINSNKRRVALGSEIVAFMEGQSTAVDPTPEHCNALANLHNWAGLDYGIASFEELVETGQTALVREDRVRRALAQYSLLLGKSEEVASGANGLGRTRLPSRFPAYFTVRLVETEAETLNQEFECDFSAMQEDASFRIELANTLSAISWYDHYVSLQQKALVDEITATEVDERTGGSKP